MSARAIHGYVGGLNLDRILLIFAFVLLFLLVGTEPAFAFGALADNIVGKATEVAGAIKIILFAAAVVSVLAGAAPMLWGEVKLKWMIGALAACTVISLMDALVNAFVTG